MCRDVVFLSGNYKRLNYFPEGRGFLTGITGGSSTGIGQTETDGVTVLEKWHHTTYEKIQ